jgi:putative transcriptional regulator
MIKCHLSKLMGIHKLKVADLARATGLNRSTISALYDEKATRIDLETIEKLCNYFECQIGDLLEIQK